MSKYPRNRNPKQRFFPEEFPEDRGRRRWCDSDSESLWAQGKTAAAVNRNSIFPPANQQFMITPDQLGTGLLSRARAVQPMRAARAGGDTRTSYIENAAVRRRRLGLC